LRHHALASHHRHAALSHGHGTSHAIRRRLAPRAVREDVRRLRAPHTRFVAVFARNILTLPKSPKSLRSSNPQILKSSNPQILKSSNPRVPPFSCNENNGGIDSAKV